MLFLSIFFFLSSKNAFFSSSSQFSIESNHSFIHSYIEFYILQLIQFNWQFIHMRWANVTFNLSLSLSLHCITSSVPFWNPLNFSRLNCDCVYHLKKLFFNFKINLFILKWSFFFLFQIKFLFALFYSKSNFFFKIK